jgi:glycerophosphoryl diester phosphodiesterase
MPAYPLPPLVGHRGAAALAPENTIAGIEAAAAAGCRAVELDVMLSADGHAVLHHDVTLKRMSGAAGRVPHTLLDELRRLDVGRAFHVRFTDERIPPLADGLRRCLELDLAVNLEIKPAPGFAGETAAETVYQVRDLWPGDRPPPLISSFRRRSLEVARDLAPELPRALIATRRPRDWRRALRDLACVGLHLRRSSVAEDTIADAHAAGVALGIYTVNDPREARTFRAWGADAIITDAPDAVGPAVR